MLAFFFVVLLSQACSTSRSTRSDNYDLVYKASFTGYTKDGYEKSCSTLPREHKCTKIPEDEASFAQECLVLGYEYGRCSCDLFLCSDNLLVK